jgi:hypothetical protein
LILLGLFVAVSSCQITRPEQENYIFDGSRASIQQFIDKLQHNFGVDAERSEFITAYKEVIERYKVSTAVADITVISIGDDRCNPNAPLHTTYKEKMYEVDLVFKSQLPSHHNTARNKLFRSAQDVGAALTSLKEC